MSTSHELHLYKFTFNQNVVFLQQNMIK